MLQGASTSSHRIGSLELIIGPMFSGKCLEENTQVYARLGACTQSPIDTLCPIKYLHVGDYVFDETWTPVRVANVSSGVSTPDNPLWRASFDNGTSVRWNVIATGDHIMPTYISHDGHTIARSARVRDLIDTVAKSKPIIGARYYGIVLESGYYFMIAQDDGHAIPSHNSSNMICAIERHTRARRKCVIIKHATDTRYGETCDIRTHGGVTFDMVPIIYARSLRDDLIMRAIDKYDVIGIDEIQFFAMYNDELARDVTRLVDNWVAQGKIVICAGLDSDYTRRPFAVIAPLVAISTRVAKLLAVCSRCGADAMFSARTSSDDSTYSDPVGGANKYIALCRACYAASTTSVEWQ